MNKTLIYSSTLILITTALIISLASCGGDSTTNVNPGINQSQDTGSVEINIDWPEAGKDITAQVIHPDVAKIFIGITGAGLSGQRQETITKGTTNKTIAGLPAGEKQFEFSGLDGAGKTLSHRITNVIVIKDQTVKITAHLGVTISSNGFFPQNIPISAGDTLFWKNNDTVVHNVVADNGSFNSGDIAVGAEWSRKFDTAGTFGYKCAKTNKAGSVVVGGSVDPNSTPTPTPTGTITPTPTQTPAGNNYVFLRKWGTSGTGNGQFSNPDDIAIDSNNNIYVADTNNYRIQKFDSSGNYITQWGTVGSGNGQFNYPVGISVDSNDNVYVAEQQNNNRIQKFDSSGNYITKWGTTGSGNGQFDYPCGIAVDSNDNIYVAEQGNNRIQKFNSSGTYITQWGSYGTGNSQFNQLYRLAIDSSNNVYAADSNNQRIQKFDSSGNYITQWGTTGSGNGQFAYPRGITIDLSGNIYVVDELNYRIQKFDSNGAFITTWGTQGSGDGQLEAFFGITIDSLGNVYVADTWNHRIQVFAPQP